MSEEELFEIKQLAFDRIFSKGYKPEDYLLLGEDVPLNLAKDVIKEMKHIIFMRKYFKEQICF